jgi:hypothetical protein
MNRHRAGLALLAATLAACTPTAALMTPPPTVKPPAGQGEGSTGGVVFSAGGLGSSVGYGPWRVKGEGFDLAYAGDGVWTGTWNGAAARFVGSQGRLQGPGTELLIEQRDGALSMRGTWAGRSVDVTVGKAGLRGRLDPGGCTLELAPSGIGALSGPVGCPGSAGKGATSATATAELVGEAVLVPHVLLPQFVMALLGSLP